MERFNDIIINEQEVGIMSLNGDGVPVIIKPGSILLMLPEILHLHKHEIQDPKFKTGITVNLPDQIHTQLPRPYQEVWNLYFPFTDISKTVIPTKLMWLRSKDGAMMKGEYTKEYIDGVPVYNIVENKEPDTGTDMEQPDCVSDKLGGVSDPVDNFLDTYPSLRTMGTTK